MLTTSFFITFYKFPFCWIPFLHNLLNSPFWIPLLRISLLLYLESPLHNPPDCFFRKAIPFYTNPLREESPFLHDCLRNLFVVQNSPILKSTPSLTISKKDFIEPCSLICVTLFLVMIIAQNTIIVNHFIHFFLTKIHIFCMDIQI